MEFLELRRLAYEANMELHRRGLIIYTWGNVSQLDRARGIFAIKPSGVPYDTLAPEMMTLVDLESGAPVDARYKPSSDAPTHLILYRAFSEIGGVTHTHSPAATAWAQARRAIPCYGTTHADYFHGPVPVTRMLTPGEVDAGYEENTGRAIVEAFQNANPMHAPGALCAGHGPFTWGRDGAESVHNAVVLEEIAKIALYTESIAPGVGALPSHVSDKHFLRKHGPNAYYGQ
jgi:L-ribulose-5-phosphate 4-epimerase